MVSCAALFLNKRPILGTCHAFVALPCAALGDAASTGAMEAGLGWRIVDTRDNPPLRVYNKRCITSPGSRG
ncbi:hypothetical protein HPA02_32620 [Bisbaumannia pacifica]|uniref:Uncharacterized protein n=1 Tax=Bisbaumannia pacifica TaxID=77098 RepID=A0A510XC21_9GAMM|nr:hypothetical protein HPA02_32620 [Halomonas pacifica]